MIKILFVVFQIHYQIKTALDTRQIFIQCIHNHASSHRQKANIHYGYVQQHFDVITKRFPLFRKETDGAFVSDASFIFSVNMISVHKDAYKKLFGI